MRKLRRATPDEQERRERRHGRIFRRPSFIEEQIVNGKVVAGSEHAGWRTSWTKQHKVRLPAHEEEVTLGILLGTRERQGMWGVTGSASFGRRKGKHAHFWIVVEREAGRTWIESVCGGTIVGRDHETVIAVHHVAKHRNICGYCAAIVIRENA